ncbi:MAG TPA: RNA polymerase sigma factor SigJ [Gemmatimonadales bacterium]|nr:RNA polymerase sigma factor SigJ [Gemmatimonadales bacterium]
MGETDATDGFERLRPRLFGIAYRMLGSADDAEDVVQEAYLRWHRAEREEVRAPEGWLVAVVTRLSIDRLRRLKTEREAYVGSWLPEPVALPEEPGADRESELASDLSLAFLLLLERLAPEERAAFLLREVFDADYAEIARVLEKSEAACRQMVHRARERIRSGRPRFRAPAEAKERLLGRFLAALAEGNKDELLSLFTEDAVFVSDSGGKVPAARNVLVGPERIVRLFLGIERKYRGLITHRLGVVNGEPAVLTYAAGRLAHVTSFAIETPGGDPGGRAAEGRIAAVYRVLNPDKLARVARAVGAMTFGTDGPGGGQAAADVAVW